VEHFTHGWPQRDIELIGMSFVAGIGFTVYLLVGELSYGPASETEEHVKVGVLLGSLAAAIIGGLILSRRNRISGGDSSPERPRSGAISCPCGEQC
jgi:Na+/H+ antiporter 1